MRRTEHRQTITRSGLALQLAILAPARADALPQARLKSIVLCVAAALSVYPYLNAHAQDLPTNPQVVGGAATVTQSGNQQTVTQTTNRAIVNWGGFSIGANNSVNFIQPGSSSVILNRVIGNDPSSIFGSLTANGKVFLVNPNGIFFGAGSSIDTGGLVATTMSIRDNDFMSGYFNFERSGAGQVENAGLITIREGGYALLAADQVSNTATGVINAPKGSVALTSADRVTIETNQDGLVGFSVSGNAVREVASVDNAGLISADGGRIMLSARGAQELTGMVVNNSGTVRAQTVEEQDGAIILSGSSGTTQSSGVLDASGSRGGNIQVTNEQGVAAVAGQLTASGNAGDGGRIVVAGQQTGLFANTDIDVSGTQGGTVRVGGEYRGDAIEGITSQQTYVASSANIKADGTAGDGGSVVVWADDVTRYDGSISARGTGAGKGGDAEVSGKEVLAFNGTADLSSTSGRYGTLLLDPNRITITDVDLAPGDAQDAQLDDNVFEAGDLAGTDSFISRGKLEDLSGSADVVLEATEKITLNNLLGDGELNMQADSGSLTLRTTASSVDGGIEFLNLNNRIVTQGGNVTISAGGSGSIKIGGISSAGGDINLDSSGGSITTGNLSSSGGAGDGGITINSDAALTTGSLTSGNGNIGLVSTENMITGAISSGAGTVSASSGGTLTTGTVTTSNANVALTSTGNTNLNNVNSGSGGVGLTSAGNIHIRNVDTSQTLSLNAGGAITQQAATRIAANTVSIVNASTVNLTQSNFANNLNANVNGSSFAYKDTNALTVNNVTVNNGAGNASLSIETGGTMTVAGNVSVTGTGNATNRSAAVMNLRATGGNVTQNDGAQITATDNGAFINNTSQETHFAQVTLKADNGGVITKNVSANSPNGRAQVIVDGRYGIEARSGSITATAASQPGVSIFSKDGNITTTNAIISTVQTREVDGPQNSKANPNKVVDKAGGISIDGGTLNLGRIESRSTAASGIALFGIATASRGNTTFNQLVNTNADAGISVSTTGTNALVSTSGLGLLDTKALALTGDRDKGFFRVRTDVESLTVLGGKAVDLDNTAHGAGVLTISALGRISDATTDPNTNTEIPATNKPVGGVRIQSQNIELLSLENRSTNSYLFDGTQTSNILGVNSQQDLRLIANNITFIPGTIQTKADTLVQLRPLTNSRNMQLALANATIPANTTFYSGDQIVGLLNQFNPDSVMVIGGANAIDVYGGTNAYSGNITVGSSTALADQISLGDMTLRFITDGRVFNNFSANTDIPISWINNLNPPDTPSPGVICAFGQSCIRNMTTGQIFIKDSLKQGNPDNNDFRDVVFQGTGSGLGGTEPTGNSATNTGGGGGDSGGGNSGGGGGGGGNDNDSGPGGSNAPSDNPGGGGNTGDPTPGDGTTQATNNPGQGTGNPGGNPGSTTDPTTPGGNTNTGTPQDSSNPTGDTLAGGGSFSGNDGSTGNTGNTGGNTNTGGNNTGGGNTSNNNNNQNTGNNPTGGGTLSDGSTPGGNNNTQVGDSGNNGGFTGGGNNSNNGNSGTGSNNTNTAGTGGTGGTGGGTFSDGSGATPGGTQVAGGSGGSGSNSGGFSGGGANSSGSSGGGGAGSSGGGTFSDGSGSTPGGTQIAGGSGGSGGNSGGFTGGGANSGGSSAGGGAGGSGGGTFSDGSGATSGGTQVAGGSNQGSGSGQSGSSSSQGSGGTQGAAGSQADAGGFSGGGSGTSGSQSAGNDSGGFVGGGSSSTTASSGGSTGGTGGGSFSDGSGGGSPGGTMLADGGQTGTGQSVGQGSDSQGGNAQGSSSGQGNDSGAFSGGASGAAGDGDSSQTQTASNQQQTGNGSAGNGDSVFSGGAAGGGSGDASGDPTQMAENTQEQSQDYPECGDEGQSVKQVSRAGQPNADMVQMKATGVRLRGDSGSLNQQRASCSRAMATN